MKNHFSMTCRCKSRQGLSSANSSGRGLRSLSRGGRETRPPFRGKVYHVDVKKQDNRQNEIDYDEESTNLLGLENSYNFTIRCHRMVMV